MTNTAKETKAQKVERLKRAKNPWEGLEEIRRFAREGFESIPPEWIGTYFRWWGVYTQGDGAGVTGGQGGEGRALRRFMVRIRIPNGMMSSRQLRAIADLTRQHANGIADLTVRQNIQLHWVTIESLPEVLEGLWQVGLNTTGACGDVVRNVTGCPVAGVDADEIVHSLGTFSGPLLVEYTYAGRTIPHLPVWLDYRNGKLYPNDRPGLGVKLDLKPLKLVTEITQPVTARAQTYFRPDGSITNW